MGCPAWRCRVASPAVLLAAQTTRGGSDVGLRSEDPQWLSDFRGLVRRRERRSGGILSYRASDKVGVVKSKSATSS
jgi:hypothetical protein